MTLAARGARFLNRTLAAAAGVTVVYTRGLEAVTLTAVVGQEDRDEALSPGQTQGARNLDRERDYLVLAADLERVGFGEPREGDRITELINGDEWTWEVRPRDREPAFRWSDLTRTLYRVHTRKAKG